MLASPVVAAASDSPRVGAEIALAPTVTVATVHYHNVAGRSGNEALAALGLTIALRPQVHLTEATSIGVELRGGFESTFGTYATSLRDAWLYAFVEHALEPAGPLRLVGGLGVRNVLATGGDDRKISPSGDALTGPSGVIGITYDAHPRDRFARVLGLRMHAAIFQSRPSVFVPFTWTFDVGVRF